jgi:hypothetical protein
MRVDQEQCDVWLGHNKKRAAKSCESFDPEYLLEAKLATESIIAELQRAHETPTVCAQVHI